MKFFKQMIRNFLIRLMTVLGFGGMTAFCVSSCQSTSANNDKQPKQEANDNATTGQNNPEVENQQNNADDQNADNQEQPKKFEIDESFFEPNLGFEIPVTKYGIQSPLPPDAVDHLDEMVVPPTPELNDEIKNRNNTQNDAQDPSNLKAEYTEEELNNLKTEPEPVEPDIIVTKYGVRPVEIVTKYGIVKPPTKYGPPRDYKK